MNARDRLQIDRLGSPSFDEWCAILDLLAEDYPSLSASCASLIDRMIAIEEASQDNWEADLRIRQALEEKVDKERKP